MAVWLTGRSLVLGDAVEPDGRVCRRRLTAQHRVQAIQLQDCRAQRLTKKLERGDRDTIDAMTHGSERMVRQVRAVARARGEAGGVTMRLVRRPKFVFLDDERGPKTKTGAAKCLFRKRYVGAVDGARNPRPPA
jgi:hypothetical protein